MASAIWDMRTQSYTPCSHHGGTEPTPEERLDKARISDQRAAARHFRETRKVFASVFGIPVSDVVPFVVRKYKP
jgi:hypothetical protein